MGLYRLEEGYSMPIYPYRCKNKHYVEIDKPISLCSGVEHCHCGEVLERVYTVPNVTGTRDGFGVKNAFYSPHAKKYIDNWKSWKKAGYSDPKHDDTMSHTLKEKGKEKMDKINFYKSQGINPEGKTGMKGD